MSETKPLQQVAPVETDDAAQVVYRAKSFWEQNKKIILGVIAALVALAAIWIIYKTVIAGPKEEKAAEAIWKAQQYFEKDSIRLALQGDGRNAGFEKVAKNFGGTKAGNLAKYYAGICYLKLNDPSKASNYLKDFDAESEMLQAVAYARLGDAYSDMNKVSDAVEYYEKAAEAFPDDAANSAEALFRAGLLSQVNNKNEDAIKYFKQIKQKYPLTERGRIIDQYLASLGVLDAE